MPADQSTDRSTPGQDPPSAESPGGDGHGPRPGSEAAHDLLRHINELREYFSHYVSAKVDGIKASVRQIGVYAALGVMGLMAVSTLLIVSLVLLLVGIGGGLARLYNTGPWLGYITVGVVVPVFMGLAAFIGVAWITRTWRKQTVEKYEQRQHHQRTRFGHDVHQQAALANARK